MSKEAAALLKHYLEQRRLAGEGHVYLRPGVMAGLKHAKQGGKRLQGASPPVAAMTPPEPARIATPARLAEPRPSRPSFAEVRDTGASAPSPAEEISAVTPTGPLLHLLPEGGNREKLEALAKIAEASPEARALGTLRQIMVFAVGNPEARIMFIGEAPGSEEERQREPFVGPAGQKLNGIITAMGLKREDIYISNICKFRPAMENQGSGNRPPTAQEMKTCLPYILTEISIIKPDVMVALGATAATGLGITGPVSRLRGKFYPVHGIPTMVTYHPSYILREEKLAGGGIQAKRQVWEDMLQVMEKASLPISEKQKGYFKK